MPEIEREFAPCPLCKQYSHSIGEDQLAAAFNHFQSMFSHRGDGIPTQNCFDEQTQDAAQVLMAAARPTPDLGEDELVRLRRENASLRQQLEPYLKQDEAIKDGRLRMQAELAAERAERNAGRPQSG